MWFTGRCVWCVVKVPLHSASHGKALEVIQYLRERTKSHIVACDVNKGDLRRPLLLSPPVHAIGAATAAAIPVAEATDRLKVGTHERTTIPAPTF